MRFNSTFRCFDLHVVFPTAGSATSSPAMLGIKEHRSDYHRAQSTMQFYKNQGDNNVHKYQYTGKQ